MLCLSVGEPKMHFIGLSIELDGTDLKLEPKVLTLPSVQVSCCRDGVGNGQKMIKYENCFVEKH